MILSNACARCSCVELFLRTLTIPNLFRKGHSIRFLCPGWSEYGLKLDLDHTPDIELGILFIQSHELLIRTESTPAVLSAELLKHCLQFIIWRV